VPDNPPGLPAYADALRLRIQKEGPCSLAALGEAVQPPPGGSDLTQFVQDQDDFIVEAEGMVSLAQVDSLDLHGANLLTS
jgi:hypothetical protein